jgi:hypothetical protein
MSADVKALPRLAVSGSRVEWRPYLAGAGIGVLSWVVFAFVDDPLGITTALSDNAEKVGRLDMIDGQASPMQKPNADSGYQDGGEHLLGDRHSR